MKQILIVWHSHTGRTAQLVANALAGARAGAEDEVHANALPALQAGPQDLLRADALLLATPENFGYLSGALKDFLERTYYACEGQLEGLPFAMLVSAGNDGSGAVESIRRIARGHPFKEIQPPLIVRGEPQPADLESAHELGAVMAAGVALGVF